MNLQLWYLSAIVHVMRFFSLGRLGKKDSKPSTLQSNGFSGERQLNWNNVHQLYSAFSIMDMFEAGIYFSTRTKRNVWNQGLNMITGDLLERTQYGLTIYLQSALKLNSVGPLTSNSVRARLICEPRTSTLKSSTLNKNSTPPSSHMNANFPFCFDMTHLLYHNVFLCRFRFLRFC